MADKNFAKTYTILDANGNPYNSNTKGTLGGHRKLKIYGRLDCPSALRYIEKKQYVKNRVFSQTKKQQSRLDIVHVRNV